MHGDEVVGRELTLSFAQFLLQEYDSPVGDERIKKLINDTYISILPSMNPDGFELHQRQNKNGFDLNRNFDDHWVNRKDPEQPEMKNVAAWVQKNHYVLSANFHGGSVVANYPWDGLANGNQSQGVPHACPDDAFFKAVSLAYTTHNDDMLTGEFKDSKGLTNGANWYTLYGGMQDWNYVNMSCFEITLEVSMEKWPNATDLPHYWNTNRESMISYAQMVHSGVKGTVVDENGRPLGAKIDVGGIDKTVHSDANTGVYFRLLVSGKHEVRVSKDGYNPHTETIEVKQGSAVLVHFTLSKYEDRDWQPFISATSIIIAILVLASLVFIAWKRGWFTRRDRYAEV